MCNAIYLILVISKTYLFADSSPDLGWRFRRPLSSAQGRSRWVRFEAIALSRLWSIASGLYRCRCFRSGRVGLFGAIAIGTVHRCYSWRRLLRLYL
ncbi:MAG: hypothetical protein GDA56_14295 [Hormoscilla sp. GM7CHS1pb]|nr:hypothetical protein [Hormoscilla sp. GM7CHS1pb]